jgi:hypothetical protein
MKSIFCALVILLLLGGADSFGQTQVPPQQEENEVLAQGNPPLTLGLSGKFVEFFEWSLDSKFTKSQRALFTMRLLQVWEKRDQSTIDGLLKMRRHYDDLAKVKKEERDEAQRRIQAILLEAFVNDPSDNLAELLLSVYTSSHPEAAAKLKRTQAPVNRPGAVAHVPTELVGEWIARRGSGGSYVNPNTGQYSAPNATIESYKIFADGSYEHGMLMQSSLYNCTTTIVGREVGPVMVQGPSLTITPQPGTLDYKSSCSPHLNELKQTNFPPKTFSWRVERGEFGLQLCLQNAEGASACFLKQ